MDDRVNQQRLVSVVVVGKREVRDKVGKEKGGKSNKNNKRKGKKSQTSFQSRVKIEERKSEQSGERPGGRGGSSSTIV